MAVLRNNQEGTYNTTASIGSTGALLCLVVAILGIKLKWFRHQMNFDSNIPTAPERGASTSNNQPILLTGVFKQNIDFDSFVEIKQPKQLPPVRVHKNSKIILPPKKESYQNGTAAQPLIQTPLTNGIAIKPVERPTQLDITPSYRNDSIISNGPPPALPLSPPPQLEENGYGEEILTIVVPQTENKIIKLIPPPPAYSPPRPAQPEEHKLHFIKKQQGKQPSPVIATTQSQNLSNSLPNLNQTNHNNNNNQNPVLALSIPNINTIDPLPTPAKKGFFGFPSKEKKKETVEKPKKILKVKKVKEPKPIKVKEPKPAKPIKEKENKIKNLQKAAAPEVIPKSLEPFLKVKIPENKQEEVGAAYNDQITIKQPAVGSTYNDTISINTTSVVGATYNDQITFKPAEVGAATVKPAQRTTGINYATQNTVDKSPIIADRSFVRLESYDEIKHRHQSQTPTPTTPKLDDDDDFGNWNAVAKHRRGITQTTAVVQAAQVKTIVRTNAAATSSNDNANLLMARPKTLREQQSAQRNNNINNSSGSSSRDRDNSGFKLRRSDSEESDTEA